MRTARFATLLLLLGALPAFAFDPAPRPLRVAVLEPADGFDSRSVRLVARYLREELRERGAEVFAEHGTIEDVKDGVLPAADYYIEVADADSDATPWGAGTVAGDHAAVSAAIVVTRVRGEVRLYDGGTLEPVAAESLAKRNTAFVPFEVGFGGRHFFAMLGLPLLNEVQYRRAAHAVASDAAERLAAAMGF
jgi:hypothetical protein